MKTDSESDSRAVRGHEKASQQKKDAAQKNILSGHGTNLQEILDLLQKSPEAVQHLPPDQVRELAGYIGNQRLQEFLSGGGKGNLELICPDLDIGNEEKSVNDISTEAPELIELSEQ
ncbi:hypothetical protein SAMN06296386_104257 [Lachnospiraceae bacterium]|nr:hypothetical protein SAMN06296386_104257 [Lachnospiraceae bacterium]